ncbi:MAG TPA: hypothetical protein ENK85_05015, partial [Saprospiraceae bacterium]|nr:hypothetical protein [Saprospiraceae bacterium]
MKYSLAIFIGMSNTSNKPLSRLLPFLSALLLATMSYAQCPANGDITFTSQADIDAFGSNYPSCTTITGNVTIQENTAGDITNFNGLHNIQTIDGSLYIDQNSALDNMSGLNNLQTVTGDFYIFENNNLTDLTGLGSLSSVQGDYFYIGKNDHISTLSGLNSLTTIDAHFYVGHNDNLQNLSGVDNLTTANGAVTIEYNQELDDLSGLNNLQTIGDNLLIGDNYYLATISQLSNLSSVDGYLWLGPNQNLPTFNGLENLNTVGAGIWIGRNNSLTDMSALSGITSLGDYLMIDENNSLQNLNGLHNISSVSGLLWIGNNNSLTDISFTALTSVNGDLLISDNNSLENLNGLSNLSSINGNLHLTGNYALNNIAGIAQVDHTTINNLSIYYNDNLSSCSVNSVCNYLELPAPSTDIHDNLTNCNSDSEISTFCHCNISATTSNILCNDNGTPSNPDDDIFYFDINVTGNLTGANWTADDPNNSSGNYGVDVNLGTYPISGGDLSFTVTDADDNACSTSVNVSAPMTCSNQCSISATVSNILCNDNGTPSDASDDIFNFDLNVTGSNTGAGWTADDPNTSSGNYDVDVNLGTYSISGGDLSFTVTDADDNACSTNVNVSAP